MVIFVPFGDPTGQDSTRDAEFYDSVWNFLITCGATALESISFE